MATSKTRTQVQYRSAKDGQFTTRREAERSPSTHVREVNKIPAAPAKKAGK